MGTVAQSHSKLPIRRELIFEQIERIWPDKHGAACYLAEMLDRWSRQHMQRMPQLDYVHAFTVLGVTVGMATGPEQCVVAFEKALRDLSFPINY